MKRSINVGRDALRIAFIAFLLLIFLSFFLLPTLAKLL